MECSESAQNACFRSARRSVRPACSRHASSSSRARPRPREVPVASPRPRRARPAVRAWPSPVRSRSTLAVRQAKSAKARFRPSCFARTTSPSAAPPEPALPRPIFVPAPRLSAKSRAGPDFPRMAAQTRHLRAIAFAKTWGRSADVGCKTMPGRAARACLPRGTARVARAWDFRPSARHARVGCVCAR